MKKFGIIMVCVAAVLFASCGTTSTTSRSTGSSSGSILSSNTAATANGTACGQAIIGLYNNYKSTKKLDMTNASNITNTLALVTAYSQLKSNKGNSSYRKSFISGMVLGGAGIITNNNAGSIVNQIESAAGLSSTTRSNISTAASTVSSILSILQ
ncbi:MAG: hypothetical protein II975_08320 [Bacteroidales bacterium]|jgi:hypothetical protein|nr:hypothetical protein [Bacteroidales bacterium]